MWNQFFKPSFPPNVTNWRVFNDDEQLLQFIHDEDTFKGQVIDDEAHKQSLKDPTSDTEKPCPWNSIPRALS